VSGGELSQSVMVSARQLISPSVRRVHWPEN